MYVGDGHMLWHEQELYIYKYGWMKWGMQEKRWKNVITSGDVKTALTVTLKMGGGLMLL